MGQQIFERDTFEAWVHGPVSRTLYGIYSINGWNCIKQPESKPQFSDDIEELLESVWITYGDKDGNELEALSHSERPWKEARLDLNPEERGDVEISTATMAMYYRSIYTGEI